MDHILDQSPIQERTPSVFDLPSPGISSANGSGSTERRPSVVSNIINPLTGQPGATSQSRHDSTFSGVPSPIQPTHDMGTSQDSRHSKRSGTPLSRSTAPGVILTASSPEVSTGGRFAGVDSPIFPISPLVPSPKVTSRTASTDTPRQLQTAEQLASRLPAHLQALRTTPSGTRGLSSSSQSSPTSSPEKIASSYVPAHTFPPTGPSISVTRKTSLLPMAPADSSGGGRMSSENAGPPILANPKCSGYFVEPVCPCICLTYYR